MRAIVPFAALIAACTAGPGDPRAVTWVAVPGQGFEMARSEVTVWQYLACVEAGACSEPEAYDTCTWGKAGMDDHPVNCVSWEMASAFAAWVDGRLATESEWSYAARGGQDHGFAGSDEPDEVAWTSTNSGGGVHPVCTRKPNGYGLCDMSGNLFEYTDTVYPEARPDAALVRVGKGGSWAYTAWFARLEASPGHSSSIRCDSMGIRPVR